LQGDYIGSGQFIKKAKHNNSFYKTYQGDFKDGVPHGKESTIEIKLTSWPRYHALISKFNAPALVKEAGCRRKRPLKSKS